MATIVNFSTTATAKEQANPIAKGYYNSVVLGKGANGTITAGTVTIQCKAPDAAAFETPVASEISATT